MQDFENSTAKNSVAYLTVALAFCMPFSTAATSILFPLAAILSLYIYRDQFRLNHWFSVPAINVMFGLFIFLMIGSLYASVSWPQSFLMLKKYSGMLFALGFIPILSQKQWRDKAISCFLIAMFINFIIFMLARYYPLPLPPRFDEGFHGRISASLMLSIASYICLVRLYFSTTAAKKILYALLAACLLFNIFAGTGRAGYGIALALVALFGWEIWRWRGLCIGAIVLVLTLIVALNFSHNFQQRMLLAKQDITQYQHGQDDTSVGLRFSFWKNSLQIVKQHPIIGSGTGSFTAEFAKLNVPLPTHNPHNEYLNIAVQLGSLGLLYLIFMFYYQWRTSKQLDLSYQIIAKGLILSIIIGCFANSWLMDSAEGHFYVYFIAVLFSSLARTKAPLK